MFSLYCYSTNHLCFVRHILFWKELIPRNNSGIKALRNKEESITKAKKEHAFVVAEDVQTWSMGRKLKHGRALQAE